MSFTVTSSDQRSDAWRLARVGRVTSSRAAAILSKGKKPGEESVARRDLRLTLACEILTGEPEEDGWQTPEMRRGTEKEPLALRAYQAATGELARAVGFCAHDTLPVGASPDAAIGRYVGLAELKCPKTSTHLGYLRSRVIPKDYMAQVLHQMFVTGVQWVDWVSFDDRLPAPLRLVVIRVKRADVDLAAYELALRLFLNEVESEVAALQQLMAPELVPA